MLAVSNLLCGSDREKTFVSELLSLILCLTKKCNVFLSVHLCACLCLSQVDRSVFDSREMVQSLAFGLSFLQRMDMKPVVVMSWSEYGEMGPAEPVAGSWCSRGLVERSQQLTEALQQHSTTVLPFFSAESFLLLHEAPRGSR